VWISPDDHKVVGSYLGEVRRAVGVSQDELAARLRKPQSFVSSYERGQRRVDFLEFAQIMIALGQDPCEIGNTLLDRVVPHVRQMVKRSGAAKA
jgi:transcriptional regulator with XRE-family HTH domain